MTCTFLLVSVISGLLALALFPSLLTLQQFSPVQPQVLPVVQFADGIDLVVSLEACLFWDGGSGGSLVGCTMVRIMSRRE